MMLKQGHSFLTFCGILFLFNIAFAQNSTNFGIKGGLNITFFNVDENDFGENPDSETGYYGGLFVDIEVDEFMSFQPELLYIGLSDFKFLNAPIYLKYQVAQNFDVLVGPSLNYFFDFFSNKFKVRADIAAAYNITPKVDAHMKYTLGFEEISPNGLFIGIGYRL